MRRAALAILLASLPIPGGASVDGGGSGDPRPAWVERDIDRPGRDFRILWLRGGPEGCQEACAQNPLCKSYTYVRPGIPGRLEGCWLKDGIPPPVADECCVSGVKSGETVAAIPERRIALPGGTGVEAAPEPEIVPEPPPGEPGDGGVERPATGSGLRVASRTPLSAVPPSMPGPLKTGAGKRTAGGLSFAAAPPSVRSSAPAIAGAGGRRRGGTLRRVAGVRYRAAAPAAPTPTTVGRAPGGATRTVRGVEIKAMPPGR